MSWNTSRRRPIKASLASSGKAYTAGYASRQIKFHCHPQGRHADNGAYKVADSREGRRGRESFFPPRMNPLTPYPITPLGSFIGFVLAVIPLPLQFRTWNTAICVYGLWLAITNFQYFINFVIWHDNVDVVAPVWCDIGASSRWMLDEDIG